MSYPQQLDQLMAEYQKQRTELVNFQRELKKVSASATSPRRVVKATVGNQGELTGLSFPTRAYRNMTPVELADVVLATVREARAKAMESVEELIAPRLPEGAPAGEWLRGEYDFAAQLPDEPEPLADNSARPGTDGAADHG